MGYVSVNLRIYTEDRRWVLDKMASVVYPNAKECQEYKDYLNSPDVFRDKATWSRKDFRDNFDLRANWIYSQLARTATTGVRGGIKGLTSDRRNELYAARKLLRNLNDTKILWNMCPVKCAMYGQYINYGLGETKILVNRYLEKKGYDHGLRASFERTDPTGGYTMENIDIISVPENKSREDGVNWKKQRKIQKLYNAFSFFSFQKNLIIS